MDAVEALRIVLELAGQYPCSMTDKEREAMAIVEHIAEHWEDD